MSLRALSALGAIWVLASCSHTEPWSYGAPVTGGPFSAGVPLRLTLNPLPDVTPVWMPDGSAILYASERSDRSGDRCLMLMAPEGGRSVRGMCYPVYDDPPNDSLRILAWGALSPGGRLVYSATTSRRIVAGRVRQLKWGSWTDLSRDHRSMSATLDLFGGRYLEGVAFIRWLDEDRFVYRADFLGGGGGDSIISGRQLMLATIGPDSLLRQVIAGTDYASSVAVLHPDTIVFTRGNDTRVFALALSTGAISTLWDFGAGNVTRDVHVSGTGVVTVVGGFTAWQYDTAFTDTVQIDGGGDLWHLDRATLTARKINADSQAYRHPALSPDGRRVVAVAAEDLFLFDLP